MTAGTSQPGRLRVIIVGGGVAGLEAALALADLAPDRTDVTMIEPNTEFVYRPMAVREPFAYGAARRYPLAPIVRYAGARLLRGELGRIDPARRAIHTKEEEQIEYDALLLALGVKLVPRYAHALTIDDSRLDETLHGLIQDVEGGYVHSLAFVSPDSIAWPLPLYELALMTAGRAYDMEIDLAVTVITHEPAPLAVFGAAASSAVGELLRKARIETIASAAAEVPTGREVLIRPGDRRLQVDRVIALPELNGPSLPGIPVREGGFIPVDAHGQVPGVGPIYAAGDAADFAVKQGGIASQQADAAAEAIAASAGAPITPRPFEPVVRGMLLTDDKPLYMVARLAAGQQPSSEVSDRPSWTPSAKIAAKYLAPYLEERDRDSARA
jgi:sulfide:quinone oxidoreductase